MTAHTAARWARTALAYSLSALVGWAAFMLHVPLAWVLAPLLTAATLSVAGVDLISFRQLRQAGQVVVGASIGLNVTAAAAASMLVWILPIVITGLLAVLVGGTLSVGFARLAKIDRKTAFFAMLPGGVAEMGTIGASVGARPEPIAVAQSLRVALTVLLIPMVLFLLNETAMPRVFNDYLSPGPLLGVLTIGAATAYLAHRLRLNNPWAIGPLVAAAVLTSTGVVNGHIPRPLLFAGQLMLGFAIGSLFRRELVRQLPRVVAAGATFVILALSVMCGIGAALSALTGLDVGTAILGAAPGGMTEMAITADALHLNTALIAIFHVFRAVMVNGFATYFWALFHRSGYLTWLEGLLGRRAAP